MLESKISSYLIFPKLLVIGISLQIGIIYCFPSIVGVDAPYHLGLIKDVLSSGRIITPGASFGSMYMEFPAMHLSVVINMLITNLNYKDALTTSVTVPFCFISISYSYLLARKLFSEQVGLIAGLVSALFPFTIWLAYIGVPFTFGISLIPIAIYLMFSEKFGYRFLSFIVIAVLFLSHPLAMLMFLVIATGILCYRLLITKRKPNYYLPFILFLIIACFARWTYPLITPMLGRVVVGATGMLQRLGILLTSESSITDSPYISTNISSITGYYGEILNDLGFSLFIGFAILGILYLLRKKNGLNINSYLCGTIIFTSIALFATFLSIQDLIPHRWLGLVGIILSPCVAIGIIYMFPRAFLSSIFVSVLVFLMITSSVANMDSPIYAAENTVRYAYTSTEISSAKFTLTLGGNNIYIDKSYTSCFQPYLYDYNISANTDTNQGYFVIRKYIYTQAFYAIDQGIAGGRIISTMTPEEKNNLQQFQNSLNKIYQNNDVGVFYSIDMSNTEVPIPLIKNP